MMNNRNSCDLLVDADDTLWENNIYYERVIARVQDWLGSFSVDPAVFRAHLNEKERRHVPIHGYGTLNFTRSLMEACQDFLPENADPHFLRRAEVLALAIMEHPIEILEGVPETLAYLCSRHTLYLVTKGDAVEQAQKITASGLRPYFEGVEILSEKNEEIFRQLLTKHHWQPIRTWMIGNSPRSDINPAISAGMNAVYIPHPHTWTLEHEEPVRHARLLELTRFQELCAHF
jgi:putative hydrolase of the HAD superfamily